MPSSPRRIDISSPSLPLMHIFFLKKIGMIVHVPKVGGEAIMAKVESDPLLKAECTLKDKSNRVQKSTHTLIYT